MPAGRPTEYKKEYADLARKYCLLGATNAKLAEFFEVSTTTIDNWLKNKEEFLGAVKAGRAEADAHVAESLYKRANGYEHPEDKVFCTNGEVTIVPTTKHYPPDTAAAFIWLKNRSGWSDKSETNLNVTGTVKHIHEGIPFAKLRSTVED